MIYEMNQTKALIGHFVSALLKYVRRKDVIIPSVRHLTYKCYHRYRKVK